MTKTNPSYITLTSDDISITDIRWNHRIDKPEIIEAFVALPKELTIPADFSNFGGEPAKTSFIRTDGETCRKIKLRMQGMDIEVQLTISELNWWSRCLNEQLIQAFTGCKAVTINTVLE